MMRADTQISGMQGVYLVAAELSRLKQIVSPTSRSARGADLLVTDSECRKAFSVQVKTNASGTNYWLLNKESRTTGGESHRYVFVGLKGEGNREALYFVVPSEVVQREMTEEAYGMEKAIWYWFDYAKAKPYENRWDLLGVTAWPCPDLCVSGFEAMGSAQ